MRQKTKTYTLFQLLLFMLGGPTWSSIYFFSLIWNVMYNRRVKSLMYTFQKTDGQSDEFYIRRVLDYFEMFKI